MAARGELPVVRSGSELRQEALRSQEVVRRLGAKVTALAERPDDEVWRRLADGPGLDPREREIARQLLFAARAESR